MSTVECRYCHKFGHMKSNCPELKGRYNPRKSNQTVALASSESENLATTSQSSQLSSDHPTADQVQEMIKQAFSCMGNDSNVASAFLVNSGTHSNNWYIDSGAFNHMTNNHDLLDSPSPIHSSPSIHTTNGSTMVATHIGSVSTPKDVSILDVLLVPQISMNLLSVVNYVS